MYTTIIIITLFSNIVSLQKVVWLRCNLFSPPGGNELSVRNIKCWQRIEMEEEEVFTMQIQS